MTAVTGDFEEAVASRTGSWPCAARCCRRRASRSTCPHAASPGGACHGQVGHRARPTSRSSRSSSSRPTCVPTREALERILEADMVVIGPGSLFSQRAAEPADQRHPRRACAAATGLRVYVCNVATQPGETGGFTRRRSISRRSIEHVGDGPVRLRARQPQPRSARPAGLAGPAGARSTCGGWRSCRWSSSRRTSSTSTNAHRHDPAKLAAALMRLQQEDRVERPRQRRLGGRVDRLTARLRPMLVASEMKGELARIHPRATAASAPSWPGCWRGPVAAAASAPSTMPPRGSRSSWRRRSASQVEPLQRGGSRQPRSRRPAAASPPGRARRGSAGTGAGPMRRPAIDAPSCAACCSGTRRSRSAARGPHVEFVFRSRARARPSCVAGSRQSRSARRSPLRRGRQRRLHEGQRGGRDPAAPGRCESRGCSTSRRLAWAVKCATALNRLLNAEEANLGRTVRAADRQLAAIAELETVRAPRDLPRGAARGGCAAADPSGRGSRRPRHRPRRQPIGGEPSAAAASSSWPRTTADGIAMRPAARRRQLEDEPADLAGGAWARARPRLAASGSRKARRVICPPTIWLEPMVAGSRGERGRDRRADDARRARRRVHRRDCPLMLAGLAE